MNIQRFRQVLAHIEANPQEWNQRTSYDRPYHAKPGCCFGGHARKMFDGGDWYMGDEACVLFLDATQDEAAWIYDESRTLDDFRTVARRPFA